MSVFAIPARFKGLKPISPQQIVDQGVRKTMGQIAKINGLVLGALAMHFAALGVAAFKGFMIGAIAGGTGGAVGGAIVGAQIGASIGTIVIPIPVVGTVVGGVVGGALGALAGGTTGAIILGLAGGLIAAGLYAGSATMVSMGVGAGIGGAIGAYTGAIIGSTIGTLIVAGCAIITGGACLFLTPLIPAMGFAGAAIGAVVGAFVGAAVGYVVGKYIITPIQSGFTEGWAVTKGGFKVVTGGPIEVGGGILSAGAGVVSAVGNTIAAVVTAAWNFGAGLAGGAFGGLASGLNFVVGGLTSVGLPASAAMIPVVGGVGTIAVGGIIVGSIITPASFFSPQQDFVIGGTGDNEIFTISKTASDDHFENDELPQEITYTIKLTAKADLSSISIDDKIEVRRTNGSGFAISRDTDSKLINPPCGGIQTLAAGSDWTCQFTIPVVSLTNFKDSVITNTVTVTASPQGSAPITDGAFSVTTVGKPPTDCPRGWPLEHGSITQGPEGPTSHYALFVKYGEQAIDIGGNTRGTPTFATFNGRVVVAENDWTNGGYGRTIEIEGTCGTTHFRVRWSHLESIEVEVGSIVQFGQRIGTIDATGNPAYADHLHYSFFGLDIASYIPQVFSSPSCEDAACGVSW